MRGEHGAGLGCARRVGQKGCCNGSESDEEFGAEISAEAVNEALGGGEGDGFFDVEVEAVEGVGDYEGAEGGVVGRELGGVSFGMRSLGV